MRSTVWTHRSRGLPLLLLLPLAATLAGADGSAGSGVGPQGAPGADRRSGRPGPRAWRDDGGPPGRDHDARQALRIPTSANVRVLGNVPLCVADSCGDVWGDDTLAIVAKRGGGWGLIDTRDPAQPQEIAALADSLFVQDVKLSGTLAVVSNENSAVGAGAVLYDVSNPFEPRELSRITFPQPASVHNVFLADGFLYLAHNSTGRVEIFDVRTPRSPEHVASIADPNGRIHDMVVVDGVLYSSFLGGGFTVHDVVDPRFPLALASHDYARAFTHNAWPSADGRHLFTTDEINPDGHMRVWDLGAAGGGSGPIRQVGRYAALEPAVIHNVHTLGSLVYVAYYTAGLRIVDVSEPRLPVEVAYADTSPLVGPGFAGAWGVFPYTGLSHVYVSDMQTGTWVVDFNGEIAERPAGFVAEARVDRVALIARTVYELRWDAHPQAAGYQVYRSDDAGVLARAARLGPTQRAFREVGPPGERRTYAVTAILADGTESRPTPIVTVGGAS